jgi:dTDP-4-amino-4,6-dideoxygalactose transaminase
LTLPLFPAMTDEDIGRITKGLVGILQKYRKN